MSSIYYDSYICCVNNASALNKCEIAKHLLGDADGLNAEKPVIIF